MKIWRRANELNQNTQGQKNVSKLKDLEVNLKTAFLFLFFTISTFAQTDLQVKPHMQEFYKLTNQLRPFLVNKSAYMDDKNKKEISHTLTEFNDKVKKLKKNKMTETDDMKYRAQQLAEGLDEAEKTFNDGFKDYSYWVLKSTMNNCYACHTQKSLSGTEYKFTKTPSSDIFSEAEFLFIVRNYTESVNLFEDIVMNYPKNKVSVENLESSLQKLLYFYVRVQRDDRKSLLIFERFLKNKDLPKSVRNDILAWKKYLTVKKYRLHDDSEVNSEKTLQDFVKERENIANHYKFSNQRYIVDLETSYYLYQLIEKNKDAALKPWLLYWLAYQEKDYRLNMFDITAEQYLKECIEKYSSHKAAKKCFGLYKEMIIDSYTGSRGTDVPKSVSDQLNQYEKMVNKK